MEYIVESRDSFTIAACCALLHALGGGADKTMVVVADARGPGRRVLKLAVAPEGRVSYKGCDVSYRVETSDPLPSADGQGRAEPFRRLTLVGDPETLDAFVAEALDAHREFASNRRRRGAGETMAYRWDAMGACWDSPVSRPVRSADSLFVPGTTVDDVTADLDRFLDRAATYERLCATPVRTYLVTGPPGCGKSSLVHVAASAAGRDVETIARGLV